MKNQRNNKKRLGNYGEELALRAYQRAGFTLLERQFRCPLGEIDLIFEKDDQLFFVEVRTKTSASFGTAAESITMQKRRRIRRISEYYMLQKNIAHRQPQYDLVAIYIDKLQKKAWLKRIPQAF